MALFRTTLLAATLGGTTLAALASAQAQQVDGLYVGAGAGYNFLQDLTATVEGGTSAANGVTTSAPMRVKWGGGYTVSGSLGWGFGNGLRLEVEGDYRGVDQRGGGGRQSQIGVMGNAFYDFDVGLDWVAPYVGVGIGYQAVTWNHVSGAVNGLGGGGAASIDVDQTLGGFAYQFIAGLAFPIDSVPGLSVTAEYRYMDLAGSRNYRAASGTASVVATKARVGSDASHSILIGLRYAFDMPEAEQVERPPPAAVPIPAPAAAASAAAPAPARTYLVFFDWDSAALSPRAREIIAEAVRNYASVPRTRIEVTGHADRSGTARGNQVLSQRRAQVVAAEMERQGVSSSTIDIHAAGDKQPLVPTAAGVRQPENRRVEIVYR